MFGVAVRRTHLPRTGGTSRTIRGMTTAGVGGAITGRGADLLIIDDPVKSVEDAESQTYRDRAWEWWRGVALTRLEPGGAVILVMTRWHEDDLAGRILQEDASGWRVRAFPLWGTMTSAIPSAVNPARRSGPSAMTPTR